LIRHLQTGSNSVKLDELTDALICVTQNIVNSRTRWRL